MPRLYPSVYREAASILMYDSNGNHKINYACHAIKKAIQNRNARRNENLSVQPYIKFLFLVYAPERLNDNPFHSSVWRFPSEHTTNSRKFALHFLANMLDSGMSEKDFK